MQTEMNVVVIDKKNQVIIPGFLLEGNACTLEESGVNNQGTHTRAVIKATPKPEYRANLKDYPDIIMADESLIFDADEFYSGKIPFDKYIDPVYKIGDYVVGIANPNCKQYDDITTTIRLVGGIVKDVQIKGQLGSSRYSYDVEYTIQVDVKYSVEQLRRDGMKEDKYYAVQPDETGHVHITTVNESTTMTIIDNMATPDRGLHESEKFILFYIMAVLLMKAQMRMLTAENVSRITGALLQGCICSMFPDKLQTSLEKYESPLRSILHSFVYAMTAALDPKENTEISEALHIPRMVALLAHGDIFSEEICSIPWDRIMENISLKALIDPEICGIEPGVFTDMIVRFINDVSSDPKVATYAGNLHSLSEQLYSCIKDPIEVGSQVRLDPENIVLAEDDSKSKSILKTLDDCANRGTTFRVENKVERNGSTIVSIRNTSSGLCFDVHRSSCILHNWDLQNMDKHIFTPVLCMLPKLLADQSAGQPE